MDKHHGEQLKDFIRIADLNITDIAESLKVARGTVYNLFGKRTIEDDVIEKLKKAGVDFLNKTSVQTLVSEPSVAYGKKSIPFYDIDVTASQINVFKDQPEVSTSKIIAPGFEDCEFGIPVYGHSMSPTFENGVVVLCKRITDFELILYGEAYLIVTNDHRMVKRLFRNGTKDSVIATSDNNEKRYDGKPKFESFEIPIKKILHLYIVKGCIKRNQI